MRRPGHRQRVHPVAVFQDVGGKRAVLAAAAGHHHVIATIIAAEFIQRCHQLVFAVFPVDLLGLGFTIADRRHKPRPRQSQWSASCSSRVCLNSTVELGRWLEITHFLQKTTS